MIFAPRGHPQKNLEYRCKKVLIDTRKKFFEGVKEPGDQMERLVILHKTSEQ